MKVFLHRLKDDISNLLAVWAYEMKLTVKDEGVLIFFVLAPILYPLLYSWIYNNEVVREVPVAIVDLSHSSSSRQFIRLCDASPDVEVKYYCNNLPEAQELVGRQVVKGVLYFPHDFAENIVNGDQAHVGVYCDMSLMLTYKAIYQTATSVSQQMNGEIQIEKSGGYTERDDELTIKPLDYEEVEIFNSTGGYGNYLLPGVLILVIQQTLILGIGLANGTNRERKRYGHLIRYNIHGNGLMVIVLGKALCYFMIYTVIAAYLTLLLPKMFSYTVLATPPALAGLLLPYILACIFFGMTLSSFVRYRENIILLFVVTSLLFLFLSGISWPLNNIPAFWQGVSWLIPSTFGIKGYITINCMGGTISDISTDIVALWIQAIVYFFFSCLLYHIEISKAEKELSNEQ